MATLLVVLLTAPAVAGERYVALGDSYSSGTGTREYRLGEQCERSRFGYPTLVAAARPGLDLVLAACTGATTSDIRARQVPRLDAATRWVTITAGGNDVGFSSAIRTCAEPRSGAACTNRIKRAERLITDREHLPAELDSLYREIRLRAPAATVIVVGYPRLFSTEDCNAATFFSRGELIRLNRTAEVLRDTIRERVAAAGRGFVFADAIAPFEGHAVCSRKPWLNGLSSPTGESYHPNRTGHAHGFAPLVLDAMTRSPRPVSDRLADDERLRAADDAFLLSADGRYRFVMQRDGNLVIYDAGERPLWQSNTPRHPDAYLIVQNDGNVVIYSGARPLWATGTDGRT